MSLKEIYPSLTKWLSILGLISFSGSSHGKSGMIRLIRETKFAAIVVNG